VFGLFYVTRPGGFHPISVRWGRVIHIYKQAASKTILICGLDAAVAEAVEKEEEKEGWRLYEW